MDNFNIKLPDDVQFIIHTSTRPASQASFATVRRLINLDTFKNLSNLIYLFSCILYCQPVLSNA